MDGLTEIFGHPIVYDFLRVEVVYHPSGPQRIMTYCNIGSFGTLIPDFQVVEELRVV